MQSLQPVVFGEVLFDTFSDGRRVIGGAPFNVAWHLHGFGLRPRFISRVGNDDEGRQVLDAMRNWGMARGDVQTDDAHPTGRVLVTIDDGEPSFRIESDAAYDFIDPRRMPGQVSSVLYHGSLAIRNPTSRQALERIGAPPAGVVCDLNLRDPWWTPDHVEWCLRRSRWLKLNAGELETLSRMPAAEASGCLGAARAMTARFGIPNLVVTRGGEGALGLFGNGDPLWQPAAPVRKMVDTVGAGDAFAAVMILGILRNWDAAAMLRRAARFAAAICGQRGATSWDRALYVFE